MRFAVLTAVLVAVAPALAQPSAEFDAELRRVQAALAVIQQTQQGVYQQFRMVQELRRAELERLYARHQEREEQTRALLERLSERSRRE